MTSFDRVSLPPTPPRQGTSVVRKERSLGEKTEVRTEPGTVSRLGGG